MMTGWRKEQSHYVKYSRTVLTKQGKRDFLVMGLSTSSVCLHVIQENIFEYISKHKANEHLCLCFKGPHGTGANNRQDYHVSQKSKQKEKKIDYQYKHTATCMSVSDKVVQQ